MTKKAPFPTRQQVVDYIQNADGPVHKRELVRAFGITGDDRVPFKELLREIKDEGLVDRPGRRRLARADALPPVTILIVDRLNADGEAIARPERHDGDAPPPRIIMASDRPRGDSAVAPGDRVLARVKAIGKNLYEGRTLKKLTTGGPVRLVAVFQADPRGPRLQPADKRQPDPIPIMPAETAGAEHGELVLAELASRGPHGHKQARVVERLGSAEAPGAISLIASSAAGIPSTFPAPVIAESEAIRFTVPEGRTDLTGLPLVTIDGADARDFDDAVWAERDGDGWHLVVAIADVSHYVRPGSALDREARNRGNSCYFPDRVIPMLPEVLSNGLCSLVPAEDRLCLAAHLWIDADGKLKRHKFVRGVMRSAARLTYDQVQAGRNGDPDEAVEPLLDTVIAPLYGAFEALSKARTDRGTLELDLPERIVRLSENGNVASIGVRPRFDSHRLIEEFMIAANVAAAEALTTANLPCLYRVHDTPDEARLDALRDALSPLGYSLPRGQVLRPRNFTQILTKAEGSPHAALVNEMILRSQAQACYQTANLGHFGLALPLYVHFTSPIRRYADLTVHRGLVHSLKLGDGDGADLDDGTMEPIGRHISQTERRAAMAERDAVDRYVAAYLRGRIGGVFSGRITGVIRAGLFVTLDETGADGLVPVSTLPDDAYVHDEAAQALVGRRWGRVFQRGAVVRVRVVEADPVTGSCLLSLLDAQDGAESDLPAPKPPGRKPVDRRRRQRRRHR